MLKLIELARFATDVPGMTAFYQQLLGCEPVTQHPDIAEFLIDDVTLRIHQSYEPSENELPPEDHIAFEVDDVAAWCSDAKQAGLTLETRPQEYDWGFSAYLRDPAGNLVEVHQRKTD